MMHPGYPVEGRAQSIMYAVYGWMSVALTFTAVTAYSIASKIENLATKAQLADSTTSLPQSFYLGRVLQNMLPVSLSTFMILLFIVQIGLVIALTAFLQRMSLTTAIVMFIIYAVTLGISLSTIFLVYTQESIAITFFVAAGMFAGMSLYGYFTKADLTSVGNIAIMILWGMIISFLINWYLQSPMFDLIISAVGVVIFALLTAYDTQKIKQMGNQMFANEQMMGKVAVIGALMLYLDFINLFLFLLRFLGNRRED